MSLSTFSVLLDSNGILGLAKQQRDSNPQKQLRRKQDLLPSSSHSHTGDSAHRAHRGPWCCWCLLRRRRDGRQNDPSRLAPLHNKVGSTEGLNSNTAALLLQSVVGNVWGSPSHAFTVAGPSDGRRCDRGNRRTASVVLSLESGLC